jgi:hypothetical protein
MPARVHAGNTLNSSFRIRLNQFLFIMQCTPVASSPVVNDRLRVIVIIG